DLDRTPGHRPKKISQEFHDRAFGEFLLGRIGHDSPLELSDLLARGDLASEDLKIDLPFGVIMELREEMDEAVHELQHGNGEGPYPSCSPWISIRPSDGEVFQAGRCGP